MHHRSVSLSRFASTTARGRAALTALGLLALPAYGCSAERDADLVPPAPAPLTDAEGRPADDVIPRWDELVARSEAVSAVRWGARGTPKSIFGALSLAKRAVTADDARSFIEDNADLFKLPSDEGALEAADPIESPLGRHYAFTQRYEGLRVHGAEVKVHFNAEGQIVAVNNSVVPSIRLASVRPGLAAARALDLVMEEAKGHGVVPDADDLADMEAPELVVYADQGEPTLAYRVVVPASGKTIEAFVDAERGVILKAPADISRYFVNGTGKVFKDNAVVATQNNNLKDSNDSASAVPDSAYSIVTLQGLAGTGKLDGQFASGSASKTRATSTTNSFLFTRESKSFSETMAYFHIDLAERYIQSLGFSNVNNRQQIYSIDRSTDDNSSYSPGTKKITFGTGGVDDAEDGEVIVHEYGHSIQDNQVPGFGSSAEGGAMGEGFGDYWAATVNATIMPGFQETCIAEWDAVPYASGVPHCLRTLTSTKHYPQDVAGEVHDDGEMWSASLWQIRTSLGAAKADKLVLQAHFLLSASANFSDGSNALVTAAKNLGFTTAEVDSVRTILKNRGFTVTA